MKTYVVMRGPHAWTHEVWAQVSQLPGRWLTELDRVPLHQARYVFYVHWSHYVPSVITDAVEAVNFHCTPLPFGRGSHPIQNLKLRGEFSTVLTAHRMTSELDAGPIYGSRGPIDLHGSYEAVLDRFVQPCVELIRWMVETEPTPQPQVGEVVRFYRLTPDELAEANAL